MAEALRCTGRGDLKRWFLQGHADKVDTATEEEVRALTVVQVGKKLLDGSSAKQMGDDGRWCMAQFEDQKAGGQDHQLSSKVERLPTRLCSSPLEAGTHLGFEAFMVRVSMEEWLVSRMCFHVGHGPRKHSAGCRREGHIGVHWVIAEPVLKGWWGWMHDK